MAKYTDEQIKKALETVINDNEPKVLSGIDNCICCININCAKALLDLINRQEAEIDRLNNELRLKVEYIHEQRDVIDEKKAEIERLKDGCADCPILRAKSETVSELYEQIEYWQRGYNDLRQENKTAKSEAIKEFAERLKE
ncbi:MAG: hypothetical protein IIW14_07740, partial [Kiritimatiellae bacterium]|nr:hypothetical protein [Kiritimatiellia bacterium]